MKFGNHCMARLLSGSCLVAMFATAPLSLSFEDGSGLLRLDASLAHARGGDDDGGDHDGRDDGGRGDDDDDDDGDDHGGRGDDDDDDRGRHGGRGQDDDDHGRHGAHHTVGLAEGVAKFESSGSEIEAVFTDGTKVEIENGRYERKNAAGRTVEERRATQADIDQLMALR